ncbi:MAG: DNA-binding transcriptional regulator [Candidatus Amoebophilus sp. 36-38]|nr:MAG: DNA-binding transcriptional regulator [Candidatus Amoebophilus sp. 36-38]
MNRVDRLMAILTTLQSKRFVPADYIADKYEISIRTVYRDLKALNEIGVPIYFEPNKGYSILQGFFLPPVSLSSEEANALILITTLSEKFADKSIKQHIDNALDKIKAILRSTDKEKADLLQTQIRIYKYHNETPEQDYLIQIQNAMINQQILSIEYINNKEELSNREVEPIGLTFYSNQWHLIAWCWKRKGYRDFKVLQIQKCASTAIPFRITEHLTLDTYMKTLDTTI